MTKKTPRGKARDTHRPPALMDGSDLDRVIPETLAKVHKPLRVDDFLRILGLPRRQKRNIEATLYSLTGSGTIVRLTGGGYALASSLKIITGVVHLQRSGVGFVSPDSPPKGIPGDIFISQQHLGDAWHGDTVEVTLFPQPGRGGRQDGGRGGKNREGRITRVIERARSELAARVIRKLSDGTYLAEPMDARIEATFTVDASSLDTAPRKHDLIRIEPGEQQGPHMWLAKALALLGDEETPSVQEELAKADNAIPDAFPSDVLREAAGFPKNPGQDALKERRDLANHPFVTIDGASARDFDDAILVEKKAGGYTLLVAIADVAHYVRPGSALDAEAFLRGNSYYFPLSVEPMLPEALSNGLCSLNPDVPRLVMVAEMSFNNKGVPGNERFYPAVIRSAARLTYDAVRDALLDNDPEARESMRDNLPMLEDALALARILAKARSARGSLDFEIPEAECVFGEDGSITGIVPRQTHFIHRMIEEFMVAANEAVARFLTDRNVPFLYRTHPAPDPDKLQNLFNVLAMTGLLPKDAAPRRKKDAPPTPVELQALLGHAKGTPSEYIVSRTALRAMMQAGYSPELDGHYGLASDCYCHFTSPIRRYADLVVHRALKAALATTDAAPLPDKGKLMRVAEHINATERTAMEAEREVARRLATLFMRDKVGEEYGGVISGVTDFGMFVELGEVMAEGMIRLASLSDDFYVLNPERQELRGERTGRVYRLGQAVRVRVADVSMMRLEINLEFASSSPEPKTAGPARRASRGKKGPPARKRRA